MRTKVINVGFDFPQSHPRAKFLNAAVADGAKNSTIKMNPDGKLFPGADTLKAVENGRLDFGWVNFSHLEQVAPELRNMHRPFSLLDSEMKSPEQRAEYIRKVNRALSTSPFQIAAVMRGADQVFCLKEPLDLTGRRFQNLRIRVAGKGVYEDTIRSLGASPIVASIVRAPELCETSDLDGAYTSPGAWSVLFSKYFNHIYLAENLMMITYILLMRKDAFHSDWASPLILANEANVTEKWEEMRRQDEEICNAMSNQQKGSFTRISLNDQELKSLRRV